MAAVDPSDVLSFTPRAFVHADASDLERERQALLDAALASLPANRTKPVDYFDHLPAAILREFAAPDASMYRVV